MRGTRLVVVGERTMKQITEEIVRKALKGVNDPELGINIIDLGLVYDIRISEEVIITMTLTTVGCPLGPWFKEEVQTVVAGATGLRPEQVQVNFTFDPPWTRDMMDEAAIAELGLD